MIKNFGKWLVLKKLDEQELIIIRNWVR